MLHRRFPAPLLGIKLGSLRLQLRIQRVDLLLQLIAARLLVWSRQTKLRLDVLVAGIAVGLLLVFWIVEERQELVILFLSERIELVVMALSAGQRRTEPHGGGGVHTVDQVDPKLLVL